MSDNWIALVPVDPNFVPPGETHQAAVELFRAIAPDADEIAVKLSDKFQFFDCGANLERVTCPKCGQVISDDWWQDRMDDDYRDGGFKLSSYSAPCCGDAVSLDQLKYDWPQAFARFGIDAMNPSIGDLNEDLRIEFERILETPLRVIYQHI